MNNFLTLKATVKILRKHIRNKVQANENYSGSHKLIGNIDVGLREFAAIAVYFALCPVPNVL